MQRWDRPPTSGPDLPTQLSVRHRPPPARRCPTPEALEWGIVARVVADAELIVESEGLARRLAAGPTVAFGATKRLVQASWTESLETQMARETEVIAAMAGAPH